MQKLSKIKSIKGYRFFQDFKWDEKNCKLFSRYNIIYGWNGTGKTTLCDFFKDIEKHEFSESAIETSLLFEEGTSNSNITITHKKLNTIQSKFHVYHQHYIQDNISVVDNVEHIFAVGAEQKKGIDELKKLKSELENEEKRYHELSSELSATKKSFEQLQSTKASEIKNAANFTASYNKNTYLKAFKDFKASEIQQASEILSDEEFQQISNGIRAEQKVEILFPKFDFMEPTAMDTIILILKDAPTNITIETLKNNTILNKWVEEGLELHEDGKVAECLFCGSQISEKRIDELKAHFNQSYKKLSDEIDSNIGLLMQKSQQFADAANLLPNDALFYGEFKDEIKFLTGKIKDLAANNVAVIADIIKILADKKSDMINTSYVQRFEDAIKKMNFDYTIFTSFSKLIESNNSKTAEFSESIKSAQKRIESYLISKSDLEISSAIDDFAEKEKSLDDLKNSNEAAKLKISKLENKINDSNIPAEAINKDIKLIMGRDELAFENKDYGYQISRNGEIANNLSKGEENAIALIYFFNTLTGIDIDIKNTIIVLDDPISSFDSNFYYSAMSYIHDKITLAGQVFIFTHQFSFFKDYSYMSSLKFQKYMMKRIEDAPVLIDEDKLINQYNDEYAYLFKKVYDFDKKSPKEMADYLQYPNIARRLLEGFLMFKIPNNNALSDKISALEGGGSSVLGQAMLRLLNNYSHHRVISNAPLSEDATNITILPKLLKYLLKFIEKHDKKHFDVLVSQCEAKINVERSVAQQSKKKRNIRLFNMPVSVKFANKLEDEESYSDFETDNF